MFLHWLQIKSFCFQAMPTPKLEVSTAHEAQAAKRPRQPSSSASLKTEAPAPAPAQKRRSINMQPDIKPQIQPIKQEPQIPPSKQEPQIPPIKQEAPTPLSISKMDAETPMDTSAPRTNTLTKPPLVSDPTSSLQSTSVQSTSNSNPLQSPPSTAPPAQSDSYMPSSGYVTYMKRLLHSRFPQDDGPSHLC